MARRSSPKTAKKKGSKFRPEVVGVALLVLGLLTALSLPALTHGTLTHYWISFLRWLLGGGRYVSPILFFVLGIWFLVGFSSEEKVAERWEKPLGAAIFFLQILLMLYLLVPGEGPEYGDYGAGGIIGWAVGSVLRRGVGTVGAWVILLATTVISFVLISGMTLSEIFEKGMDLYYRVQEWYHFRQIRVNQPGAQMVNGSGQPGLLERVLSPAAETSRVPESPPAPRGEPETLPPEHTGRPSQSGLLFPRVVGVKEWSLPRIAEILEESVDAEIDDKEVRIRARIIEKTLEGFGIVDAKVRDVHLGPAVTQFAIDPGFTDQEHQRKVRVSRIVNLANDLALALAAAPIRIEAPIPGRPYIGIEVPNAHTSLVSLRSVMEAETFVRHKGHIVIGLGRDVAGQSVSVDLVAMPHLLIAGATGSGKSVCVNAIISCLLCTHTPDTLKLLMIDPKMVELTNYNGIPHLLAPVVTDLERVVGVLKWTTKEMERRYNVFSKAGARHIVGYNEMMKKKGEDVMPYVVVIIDELADIMMVAPDEVEKTITRIAQMARATGIHLIIATQRPSVDVVTGLIKANFPARISFAVTSQVDSRVILDTPGAERLLGRGDMLLMLPDTSKLQRLQGVFVSDRELSRLVHYWKGIHPTDTAGESQSPPVEVKQQPLWADFKAKEAAAESEDAMLPQAIEVVKKHGSASVSLLQRRLRIGYARAARLIEMLEAQGIISAEEPGGRGRRLLVEADDDLGLPTDMPGYDD